MKCKDVYQHICENLDQDMNSPRCRAIKKHLESCQDCTAYLDSLRKTVSFYRVLSSPAVPKSVERELFKQIDLLAVGHAGSRKAKGSATGKAPSRRA